MKDHLKLAEVVDLPVITRLDLDVQRVIEKALEAGLQSVIIIGRLPDDEFYFASNVADGPSNLWDLEMAKKKLLDICS